MKRLALAVVAVVAACRSNEAPSSTETTAQDASMQRPLPSGMLPGAAPPAGSPTLAKSLKSAREVTTGEWIELQSAPEGESPKKTMFDFFKKDSLFVPLDAMGLLHDSFARAQPGFALFAPQLFTATSLSKLKGELREFRRIWLSVPNAEAARHRWPYSPRVKIALTDDLWKDFQWELVFTIDEITAYADAQIKKGEGAWVLTTQQQ